MKMLNILYKVKGKFKYLEPIPDKKIEKLLKAFDELEILLIKERNIKALTYLDIIKKELKIV